MRIGIDARFLTHPQRGGFKTYVTNLVAGLTSLGNDHHYYLYVDRPWANVPLLPRNFRVVIVPGNAPGLGMLWREQWSLRWQIKQDKIDVFHAPSQTAPIGIYPPLVVTIHDMIWRKPDQYALRNSLTFQRRLLNTYHQWMPEVAARQAKAIITVSQAARAEILDGLPVSAERVVPIYNASAPFFHPLKSIDKFSVNHRGFGLKPNFILAIGSADPRKNLLTLVRAYAALPVSIRAQHQLAIVWTHNFLTSEVQAEIDRLHLNQQVMFLHKVSDEDLLHLYNVALLFVFPSRHEGFGLPLLEAMACGTPVLAANNSSIPEIVGEAGILVSADDTREMTRGLQSLITNTELRAMLSERGLGRASQFSWARCAQETVKVYESCV